MHYYAQIDENNICVGMMQSEEPVTAPDTIEIMRRDYDYDLMYRVYADGHWGDKVYPEPEPLPEPEPPAPGPTNAELYEMQLIQMAAQAEAYEAQQSDALVLMLAMAEVYEKVAGGEQA